MAWLTVLGIPAMVYVMGVVALLFHTSEKPQNVLLLTGAGLLTAGIYMFHRTSIQPVKPMQERHRIAMRHKKTVRALSCLLLTSAVVLFAMHHPLSTLLVFGALAGVIAYGRATITRALRTVMYLKPLAVGGSIACFAWVLNDFSNSFMVLMAFTLFCTADALCCDLEDCAFDTATGCSTLATHLGFALTWILAGILYLGAALFLQSSLGWLFLGFFLVPLAARTNSRSIIDFRPAVVLMLLWTL